MQSLIDKYQREENRWKALPQDHLIWYFIFQGVFTICKIGLLLYGMRLGFDIADILRMIIMA